LKVGGTKRGGGPKKAKTIALADGSGGSKERSFTAGEKKKTRKRESTMLWERKKKRNMALVCAPAEGLSIGGKDPKGKRAGPLPVKGGGSILALKGGKVQKRLQRHVTLEKGGGEP